MIKKTRLLLIFLFLVSIHSFSQTVEPVLSFNFNDHSIKEDHNKITIKPVGVILIDDRFGNSESAIYTLGIANSYINLGASTLLKSKRGTVSMWVNLQAHILAGKGYTGNPFLIIKNAPGEDFIIGLGIGYDPLTKRFGSQMSRDSTLETAGFSIDTVTFNTWYHLLTTYNNETFEFYVNGKLQQRTIKNYESFFTPEDSVVLGRTTGPKNERYTRAMFDDIRFFDQVLSEQEITALYEETNPNHYRLLLSEILKYGVIALVLGSIILILIIRNKRNLKRQKEYYELNNKVTELELKVIRTQMNPHFISNNLAAIQDLIYQSNVEKAGEYLAKFSFFLRQMLDYSDKTYTSLEEELEIIQLNIELEKLRFKNNFTYKLEVEKHITLSDIYIPALITQPFIENAIWHGLLPLEERAPCITIRVYTKNSFTYLEIEDNGVGRSAYESFAGKHSKGTKLAIDKIETINRLRKSKDYTLKIIDLFDEHNHAFGTKVVIELNPHTREE